MESMGGSMKEDVIDVEEVDGIDGRSESVSEDAVQNGVPGGAHDDVPWQVLALTHHMEELLSIVYDNGELPDAQSWFAQVMLAARANESDGWFEGG